MASVTLNGTTYTDSQFLAYGYVGLFPEGIFTNLLAELNARLAATPTITTMATNSILGRISGGSGAVEVLSAANVKTILGFDSIAPLTTIAESWIGPSSTTGVYFKNGNVGIGTTSPDYLLTVQKDQNNSTEVGIKNNTSGTNSRAALRFVSPSLDAVLGSADSAYTVVPDWADKFFINANNASGMAFAFDSATQMTILTNGNVGIGTTGPGITLEVQGAAVSGYNMYLKDTTAMAANVGAGIVLGGKFTTAGVYTSFGAIQSGKNNGTTSNQDGFLTFQTNASGTMNEWVRITSTGNVGIGITTFGTSAAKVLGLGSGTAPTTAPADMAQIWVEDIAAGYAAPHFMVETNALKLRMVGAYTKTDTGDAANPFETMMVINNYDNTVKIYADGGWRTLASGW